jgi:hypothetical protein
MPLAAMPDRSAYLPERYKAVLRGIYGELDLERRLLVPPKTPVMAFESIYQLATKSANLQQRVIVERIGTDFAEQVAQLLADHQRAAGEVYYLDLSLSDPSVNVAPEQSRDLGFFFAALMVARCGSDRLRLPRYDPAPAAASHMVVASDQAKRLRDYVLDDRQGLAVP